MNTAANVLSVVLFVVLVVSAVGYLIGHPRIIAAAQHLQIPVRAVPVLGAVKFILAIGLAVGTRNVRVAEFVGLGLCLYFAVATLTHMRVKDGVRAAAPAFVFLVASLLFLLTTIAK